MFLYVSKCFEDSSYSCASFTCVKCYLKRITYSVLYFNCSVLQNDILAQNAHIVEIKVDPPADGNAATPEITVSGKYAVYKRIVMYMYYFFYCQSIQKTANTSQ